MREERLQKILARAGVSSRRAAEQLISAGRVRVNGRVVTELGSRADPRRDRVEVDGKRLVAEQLVYLVLHKPRGVVSTLSDPEGRPTVKDLVAGITERVFPIGRLDFHTSGVLLLTNDGDFSDSLLHPRRSVPKTYVVKVQGLMNEADVRTWAEGVALEDGTTRPAGVRFLRHEGGKTWLEVTLFEGRNQQIRRMGEATGFRVMRLARLAFAGITAEGLHPGDWRQLTADELSEIRQEYGSGKRPGPAPAAVPARQRRDRAADEPRVEPERAAKGRPRVGGPPRGRFDAGPPRGKFDAGPPRGKFGGGPPRGRSDASPPRGRSDASPPRGRSDAGPPRGKFGGGPPRGRSDAGPPRGKFDAGPPRGKFAGGPPRGKFGELRADAGRAASRDEGRKHGRKTSDGGAARGLTRRGPARTRKPGG
jgi:23S rRNA pseudouridine2605 synthase